MHLPPPPPTTSGYLPLVPPPLPPTTPQNCVVVYGVMRDVANISFVPFSTPYGCKPIHARQGIRSPTKKCMKELDRLASHLDVLLTDAKRKAEEGHASLDKIPSWLWGCQSPWKGKKKGGKLVRIGEYELYHLGVRIRERFPDLFDEEYHPDTYTIRATQSTVCFICFTVDEVT
ncbi:hypothetical protein Syun_022881 [Stephania yunnanensis]|uniref:Multiple inositol polyphosphate phosphatase 1 n=1 Tax=Stephania yunnanensis TaxID=152371 RepID=A0AAP0F7T9_9MAGN